MRKLSASTRRRTISSRNYRSHFGEWSVAVHPRTRGTRFAFPLVRFNQRQTPALSNSTSSGKVKRDIRRAPLMVTALLFILPLPTAFLTAVPMHLIKSLNLSPRVRDPDHPIDSHSRPTLASGLSPQSRLSRTRARSVTVTCAGLPNPLHQHLRNRGSYCSRFD